MAWNGEMIVALLSLAGTLGGSWLGVRQSNKLVNWRIDALERKMDKHNNVVERLSVAERDLKTAHKRVDAIEAKVQ